MGQKDLAEKILEEYNDVFADIINVLVFDGERRIEPSCLKETPVHSMYKADDSRLHEQERDISKIWEECDVEIAMCGIENQTEVEAVMPLRVMGYEGASYRSQLLHRDKEDGIHPIPVVTIVLYFGMDHWDKPKTLKELVKIPQGLDEYVNDCKIHVFEISWLTEEQVSMFTSDFRVVANFFVNKRKNSDYIPNDPTEITHVDEVLKLLSVMTGDKRYETILKEKKEVHSMCEVADRLENIGLAKGRAEERAKVIRKLLQTGQSPKEIQDILGYSMEEIEEIKTTLLTNA